MTNLCTTFAVLAVLALTGRAIADADTTAKAKDFVQDHEKRLRALDTAGNLAWWAASTTGKEDDFKRKEDAQNKIDAALADPKVFAVLKALEDKAADIDDKITRRAIHVLYLLYLEKQVDTELLKKMTAKANAVEEAFNKYRPQIDGKEANDNAVRDVLKFSVDSEKRQAAWESSKKVGALVEADLKDLVKLRNQAAVKLGFKNFHALQLFLNEQDGDKLLALFDELDELTRLPFRAAKDDIDDKLVKKYKIKIDELMPWHYHDPFFQETPGVFAADLDAPYKTTDLVDLSRRFYAGIGLPIDRVITASDLVDGKPGKSPHAFCTDIDRDGDVRVLANVKPNEQWASTLLHEFGHSVYSSKNIPATLPYVLRCESHILTTEGVAMMFERGSKKQSFLAKMKINVDKPKEFDETGAKMARYRLLIFSRWCQVMLRFEKGMYENPEQDLNKLWWDLVEKYQMVKRPPHRNAPDYASKIHIVTAPVYYHNYMMGELFASQVHHAIAREVYGNADPNTVDYVGNPAVGTFMKKKVFEPGRTLTWDELTEFATGSKLNAKAFAADFKAK